jgi:hypothetical protein
MNMTSHFHLILRLRTHVACLHTPWCLIETLNLIMNFNSNSYVKKVFFFFVFPYFVHVDGMKLRL